MTRRMFQHLGLLLVPVVYGCGLLAGAVRYLSPLPRGRRITRLDAGEASEFDQEGPRRVEFQLSKFEKRVAYIFKDAAGGFRAFDAECTHLACNVIWNLKGDDAFSCPCHDAGFDRDGRAIRVPARDSLREYVVLDPEEAGGRVVILLDRIKTG